MLCQCGKKMRLTDIKELSDDTIIETYICLECKLTREKYRLLDEPQPEKKLKVYDFYSRWCLPCQEVGKIIDRLEEVFPDIQFEQIDIMEPQNKKLVEEYDIKSVPTIMIVKESKSLLRVKITEVVSYTNLKKILGDLVGKEVI